MHHSITPILLLKGYPKPGPPDPEFYSKEIQRDEDP
jgi:hypothetical protein